MQMPLTLSVLDQSMLSAFGLVLNLVLIRSWGPEEFGIYAIAVALTMIAYSVQNALVGTQLASLRPQAAGRAEERELVAALWSANFLLMTAVAVVMWAGVAAVWGDRYPLLPMTAALFAAGMLLREYVRGFLFSEFKVPTVLLMDAAYVSLSAIALAALWRWRGDFELPLVCLVMAVVSALVSGCIVFTRLGYFSLRFDRGARARYARIWRKQSGWALLGAVSAELTSRAHVFIVGSAFGAAAVGVLQAGEMIFRPLSMALQGWERIAQPTFARLAAGGDLRAARSLAHLSAFGIAAISALFMIALWLGWPLLHDQVFRGAYANIGIVVVLWGITAALRAVAQVYSVELQGLARFRQLSMTGIAGSFVTLSLLLFVVAFTSFEWSVLAIGAGRLADLTLMLLILSNVYKTEREALPLARASGASWKPERLDPLRI